MARTADIDPGIYARKMLELSEKHGTGPEFKEARGEFLREAEKDSSTRVRRHELPPGKWGGLIELPPWGDLALGISAYYLYARDALKPLKRPDKAFISPDFDQAFTVAFKFVAAALGYKGLRGYGLSEPAAIGSTFFGVLGLELYLRYYGKGIVKVSIPAGTMVGWDERWHDHHERGW